MRLRFLNVRAGPVLLILDSKLRRRKSQANGRFCIRGTALSGKHVALHRAGSDRAAKFSLEVTDLPLPLPLGVYDGPISSSVELTGLGGLHVVVDVAFGALIS
jgi:hypothetical protein